MCIINYTVDSIMKKRVITVVNCVYLTRECQDTFLKYFGKSSPNLLS